MTAENGIYPCRHVIRLRKYDYRTPGAYFFTVCTSRRECVLGDIDADGMHLNNVGNIVLSVWNGLPEHYPSAVFDSFIIMPNHLHGIVLLQDKAHSLSDIVGALKSFSSRRYNEIFPPPDKPLWQRAYYEHVIRNDDDLTETREYILNNPLNWEIDREYRGR